MEDHKKVLSTQIPIEVEAEVVKPHFEVNNQITIQTATTAGNLGTWPRTVIKGSMMHEMESCNKGIMHQLAIKVMSNYL
jgi:hypothetical protein